MRGRMRGRRQTEEGGVPNQRPHEREEAERRRRPKPSLGRAPRNGAKGKPEGSGAVASRSGRRAHGTRWGREGRCPSTLRIKSPVVTRARSEHCADINHSAGEDIY